MNLCTSCGEDFGSVSAFDKHRIGKYPQTGPSEYSERLKQGLIDSEEWRSEPNFGRRCRSAEEMHALGMRKDARDRWRLPVRGTPSWTSDVKARNAPEDESQPDQSPQRETGAQTRYITSEAHMSSAEAAALLLEDLASTLVERLVPLIAAAVAPAEQASPWMNVESASNYLDTTEQALRGRVKRGEIPVYRRDGRLYFHRAELDQWVKGEL